MGEFTHKLPNRGWSKPSRNEEEYFRQEEFRKRMAAARAKEKDPEVAQRKRLLEQFQDHCPKCAAPLQPIQLPQGGAEQCPSCLGVWMNHETFDHLTHPEEKNEYLKGVLRDVLLEHTAKRYKNL